MTNERLAMHEAEDEPPLVEAVWEDVLVEFGIERDRAEQITRLVFSNPELTMTEREPDEISRIVGDELASLDLDSEVGGRSRKLQTLLVDVLQCGLDGVLLGPAVAPSDVAHDAATSRGDAFDAIRRSFRETNVSSEVIDFGEFPSAEAGSGGEAETAASAAPSGPSGPGEDTESGGFEMNRAFPQDIRESERPSESAERTEAQEILSFIDEARNDRSPIVRKQVMESLAELAKVPGIRADRQIDKLVQAYHEESDPEVRAAIVAGLETYVRDASRGGTVSDADDDDGDSGDGTTESEIDPRDASTGKFSDDIE
jgi:hypothetical protein